MDIEAIVKKYYAAWARQDMTMTQALEAALTELAAGYEERIRQLEAERAPDEPTAEMQAAGAQAIRFETTTINKLWTANKVWRAMLAAAAAQQPKKEPRHD